MCAVVTGTLFQIQTLSVEVNNTQKADIIILNIDKKITKISIKNLNDI